MKRLVQTLPLLLAALLQLLPLLRNIVANPASTSTMAFILRWGIGTGAALGAVDSVSGASGTVMNSSSNLVGTVGVPMSTNINFVINGGNTADTTADYIFLNTKVNNTGTSCALLFNNATTNYALPAGLTIKCVVVNNQPNIYGLLSGTPTTAITTNISITAGYTGGYTFTTNLHIVISAPSATPPSISLQPSGSTVIAGGNASFSVTANGTAPLTYQWRLGAANLAGATTNLLSLSNVRLSQAGNYTVVITNSAGAVTSTPAALLVNPPAAPILSAPISNGSGFQFSFVPVVGLTNTIQANDNLVGGAWNVLSNVPPPATATPVTITDALNSSNRFYRVIIQP